MNVLLYLFFGHYLADYSLQTKYMAESKGGDYYVLLAHCAVWTGVQCFILDMYGMGALWKVLFLFIGHYISDFLEQLGKEYVTNKHYPEDIANNPKYWQQAIMKDHSTPCKLRGNRYVLYMGQMFHLMQCVIVGMF
jgi:hypothetical protein